MPVSVSEIFAIDGISRTARMTRIDLVLMCHKIPVSQPCLMNRIFVVCVPCRYFNEMSRLHDIPMTRSASVSSPVPVLSTPGSARPLSPGKCNSASLVFSKIFFYFLSFLCVESGLQRFLK